jgi:hypothetical protein
MIGSPFLRFPGILIFILGFTLQAGATSAVKAVKMGAKLGRREAAGGASSDPLPPSTGASDGDDPGPSDPGPSDHGPSDHGPSDHGPSGHGPSDHGPSGPGPRGDRVRN